MHCIRQRSVILSTFLHVKEREKKGMSSTVDDGAVDRMHHTT